MIQNIPTLQLCHHLKANVALRVGHDRTRQPTGSRKDVLVQVKVNFKFRAPDPKSKCSVNFTDSYPYQGGIKNKETPLPVPSNNTECWDCWDDSATRVQKELINSIQKRKALSPYVELLELSSVPERVV